MTIRDIMIQLGFDIDDQSQNNVEKSVKNLKDTATKALGAIGVAFSVAGVASFVKDCVSVASEAEEMQNKFDVVFQGMTDEVEEWAQSYSDAIGRNKNDIKTYLADQQNLLVGFGMTRQEGAELSKQMTTLALDLASFANLDETAAVNNMTKAVMGESEAAKSLGAVLNEDTRARAMQAMGLSGTYEKLDQLTKMQVNYNAILAQSPDAIGDCERSLGSYRSTVVQFQSKLKEVKTLVGQFFMPTFQKVISFGSKGLTVLRDGVQKLNSFAEKVGGSERILKVLAATLTATFIAMNVQKISAVVKGFRSLASALGMGAKKALAFFAIFLTIALIVQDFVAFMRGDNSVIGALFDKAGIGADNARRTILQAWETIKGSLLRVWGAIKDAAHAVFGALSTWWANNGEQVKESFSKIWESVKALCTSLWNALKDLAESIFGALKVFWDAWGSTIISVFGIIWNTLISLIQPFLDFLSAVIDFLANVFAGDWEGAWNAIKDMAAAALEMLVTILSGVRDVIVEKVTGIKDAIVNGFQAAIDWITALPEQALKWGSDIVDNIVNGITGAVGKVGDAVKGVADKIKSFLGFSEPEDGPLSDFHTYMPDMIDLMTRGIAAGKERVRSAIEDLTGGMSDGVAIEPKSDLSNFLQGIAAGKEKLNGLLQGFSGDLSFMTQANVVQPETVFKAGGGNDSKSVCITQNVNIDNQFNGDRAGQEKSSEAMEKAADDSTSEMARALQFARG